MNSCYHVDGERKATLWLYPTSIIQHSCPHPPNVSVTDPPPSPPPRPRPLAQKQTPKSEAPPDATHSMLEDNLHFGCTFSDTAKFGAKGVAFSSLYLRELPAATLRTLRTGGMTEEVGRLFTMKLHPNDDGNKGSERRSADSRWALGLNGMRIVHHPRGRDDTQGHWPVMKARVNGHHVPVVSRLPPGFSILERSYRNSLSPCFRVSSCLALLMNDIRLQCLSRRCLGTAPWRAPGTYFGPWARCSSRCSGPTTTKTKRPWLHRLRRRRRRRRGTK